VAENAMGLCLGTVKYLVDHHGDIVNMQLRIIL
jgi:hypothetical protein